MTNHWINTNLSDYIDASEWQTFALCLAAAVGGAALHDAIEKPFLKLRARWV